MSNKKILIVEDEKPLREAIKFKLEKQGIEAVAASNAEEAMVFLGKNNIDLVWLDLKLPKIHGLELLKIIRENPDWKDKKVLIVSASGSDEMKTKATQLGVVGYLVKNDYPLDDIIKKAKEA